MSERIIEPEPASTRQDPEPRRAVFGGGDGRAAVGRERRAPDDVLVPLEQDRFPGPGTWDVRRSRRVDDDRIGSRRRLGMTIWAWRVDDRAEARFDPFAQNGGIRDP